MSSTFIYTGNFVADLVNFPMPEVPEDAHCAWGGDTTSNTFWITNGDFEKLLQPEEQIPAGWKNGRKSSLPFKDPSKQKEFNARVNPEKHKQGLKNAWASGKFANRDTTNIGKNQNWTKERRVQQSKIALTREKLTCPHCSTAATAGLAKRWHFDNCKVINK